MYSTLTQHNIRTLFFHTILNFYDIIIYQNLRGRKTNFIIRAGRFYYSRSRSYSNSNFRSFKHPLTVCGFFYNHVFILWIYFSEKQEKDDFLLQDSDLSMDVTSACTAGVYFLKSVVQAAERCMVSI